MSHTFYPSHDLWHIFTLTVHRVPGSPAALQGNVHSMFWSGVAQRPEPPPCGAAGRRRSVDQPAEGAIEGGAIRFGGTGWRHAPDTCRATGGYNPDRFSGQIDAQRQEFQSLVDDGGILRGEPTVFRRVRCLEPQASPTVHVDPPPFYPSRRSGCGC